MRESCWGIQERVKDTYWGGRVVPGSGGRGAGGGILDFHVVLASVRNVYPTQLEYVRESRAFYYISKFMITTFF